MRISHRHCLLGLGLITTALATTAAGPRQEQRQPVRIVREADRGFSLQPSKVLYRQSGFAVVREDVALDAEFQDLYVVNTHEHFAEPEFIEDYGETLAFEPGNFAVLRIASDRVPELSARMHHLSHSCGAITKIDGTGESENFIATPVPRIPVTVRDARIEKLAAKVSAEQIKRTISELANIPTRYHESSSGQGVAQWLAERYQALAAGRRDVTISTYDHGDETPQNSLIVRIEGKTRPDEVLILGSHIDSVNWSGGTRSRSPGADDNASGTATNLEIFRILMEDNIELERTLEIHGYAAEEVGLVGSADIARDYRARKVNVIAMVQHDMTAWKAAGTPDKIWLVSNNTDAGLNDLLANLVRQYTGLPFEKAPLSSGSSDHASWRRAGYAAAFPFENPRSHNRAIHTAGDTLDTANAFTQVAGFAKLGVAYATHFGGVL